MRFQDIPNAPISTPLVSGNTLSFASRHAPAADTIANRANEIAGRSMNTVATAATTTFESQFADVVMLLAVARQPLGITSLVHVHGTDPSPTE